MCRATPARVMSLDGEGVWLELDGRLIRAFLATIEEVRVGDYVTHYAGLILERLDQQEAQAILEALAEIDALAQQETST